MERLENWLYYQIWNALESRKELEEKWKEYYNLYEEVLPPKDFPWEGCSNVFVPIVPTAVETLYARLYASLFGARPYVCIRPKRAIIIKDEQGTKDICPEICSNAEKFLDAKMEDDINIRKKGRDWVMQAVKMGLGIFKVYWNGKANVDFVRIEDFVFPPNAKDIQTCQWVGHRFRLTWDELVIRQRQGLYKNIEKIKQYYETQAGEGEMTVEEREEEIGLKRQQTDILKEYELYEVWCKFQKDENSLPQDLVITFHLESMTILRRIEAPYPFRPFVLLPLMPREGEIYAKGLCEMLYHPQKEINTIHNQRIDNETIANAKCFKARKTARKEIGKIYPTKIFYLDDPTTDLMEFSLGDVHQSAFIEEQVVRGYAERRSKITDYVLGRQSDIIKSRATATGTLALLREAGMHFDLFVEQGKDALAELGYMIFWLYNAFGGPEQEYRTIEASGRVEYGFFKPVPVNGDIKEYLDFYVTGIGSGVTKQLEQQASLILLQQLSALYEKFIELLSYLVNPQIPATIKKACEEMLQSYYKLAKKLLKSFEVFEPSEFLPEIPTLTKMAALEEDLYHARMETAVEGMEEA